MYGQMDKNDLIKRHKALFQKVISDEDIDMISLCVSSLADLAEPELRADIDNAYDKELVDLSFLTQNDVDDIYNNPPHKGDQLYSMIDDSYQSLKDWAWFIEPPKSKPSLLFGDPVETVFREDPKTGRNDPCPCGSGKKYKKCCLH